MQVNEIVIFPVGIARSLQRANSIRPIAGARADVPGCPFAAVHLTAVVPQWIVLAPGMRHNGEVG